jgi:hypothetical protein
MTCTRRSYLACLGALAASGGAATLASCGAQTSTTGGGASAVFAAPPITNRWVNDVGDPLAEAFNERFNRTFNDRYAPRITAITEAFPDPDWSTRYEKYTARPHL